MKRNRKTTCTQEIIDKVVILIERGISWTKIEQIIGKSRETFRDWRDQTSERYQEDFDLAVKAAQERRDCGQIRAGQIEQAQKHTLKKVTKERMLIDSRSRESKKKLPPPKMPPLRFRKSQLIIYADEILDLELDPAFTHEEMLLECAKRIEELTEVVMVVTKEEIVETDPNQQAVKNVLTNCGPEVERWSFKEERVINTDDPLTSLLDKIASRPAPLPSQEMKDRADDHQAT